MNAKRGDLWVTERVERSYVIGEESSESTRYDVHKVTSVTRDGSVKAVMHRWEGTPQPVERMLGVARGWIVPATVVDVPAAWEAAKAHHFPGHPGQPMPWDDLATLKSLLAGYRFERAA